MRVLTFFQLLNPLSTHILGLCKNVEWPLVVHDLWHKGGGKREKMTFCVCLN